MNNIKKYKKILKQQIAALQVKKNTQFRYMDLKVFNSKREVITRVLGIVYASPASRSSFRNVDAKKE